MCGDSLGENFAGAGDERGDGTSGAAERDAAVKGNALYRTFPTLALAGPDDRRQREMDSDDVGGSIRGDASVVVWLGKCGFAVDLPEPGEFSNGKSGIYGVAVRPVTLPRRTVTEASGSVITVCAEASMDDSTGGWLGSA